MGRLIWRYPVTELLLLLFLYSQVAPYLSFSSALPASSPLCPHYERIALLQFKDSLSIVSSASGNSCLPSYPHTEYWKEDVDCCSWDGVTCDNATGHVVALNLFCSWLQGSIHSNSSLFLLPYLQSLDISFNNLSGAILDGLGKLPNMTVIDLSFNRFTGPIPSSIFNLKQLSFLVVKYNLLVGQLPHDQVLSLLHLEVLDFADNLLNGTLPSQLFSPPRLRILRLNDNQFIGKIPEFRSKSLEWIELSNNALHGPIPKSIFELVNLTIFSLSSNKLSGIVELDMFSKFQKLDALDLAYNGLSLITNTQVNSTWPSLRILSLSSCNMTDFPHFVSTQIRLEYLNLSHNLLRSVNLPPSGDFTSFDLRSNLIEGPLPVPNAETWTKIFVISGNKLTGEIPSSICNLTILYVLDLSNNNLSGKVPECLGSFSLHLSRLNLQMNSFQGPMPGNFPSGNNLRNLNLNGNLFEGPLSQSLIQCKSLEVLDLGNNRMSDGFPRWLESLPNLQVLILRSNRFHGPIGNPISRNPFQMLRILDLSHNSFDGLLPTDYLAKLKSMRNTAEYNNAARYMGDKYGYYQDSVTVTMKGLEFELVKILTIFTTIDLSSNKFEGQIPDIVGNLGSLKVLNLSHNNISGHIPSSLGNMNAVESLDLSSNMLVGEIPSHLTSLTSLEVLNLSHNVLEGPIPRGKQFDTFSNNSYLNNLELCGFPLSKECRNEEAPVPRLHKEDSSEGWFNRKTAAIMGYGCGLVLGCSLAYIAFSTGKPWWFVKRVEEWQYKVTRFTGRHKRRKVL